MRHHKPFRIRIDRPNKYIQKYIAKIYINFHLFSLKINIVVTTTALHRDKKNTHTHKRTQRTVSAMIVLEFL
jgi:hypothetical protein